MSTDAHRLITLVGHANCSLGDAPLHRIVVDSTTWESLAVELARNPDWSLLAHWAEPGAVHLALLDMGDRSTAIVTLPCPDQTFPSIGRHHSPAIRLERSIRDLYGIVPEQSPDPRPWLDHGCWTQSRPLSARLLHGPLHGPQHDPPHDPLAATLTKPYPFLAAEGAGVHGISVGPVHAGIIEPGHFRFSVNGETVVRLEERLGYVHKGIESLWVGADVTRGAKLAARLSGDSTVAASMAFARAVEAALGVVAPEHAQWQRALMAELERIANHLGDIGAICNDASFGLMHAHCGVLREHVLRACRVAFGHRLMMDRVVPGGVQTDLRAEGIAAITQLMTELELRFPPLIELYDNTPSLQDRTVGTGKLSVELAARFAAGGYVGRASGRTFDARRVFPYAPYGALTFDVPTRQGGDVNDRVWIRILEVRESIVMIRQMLDRLPQLSGSAINVNIPAADIPAADIPAGGTGCVSEGAALVEGFRGDIFAWVRMDERGRIGRCHLRDPSWFHWPLLEAVVEGNIVADFPLCNKSFNCSYSGHDG